MNRFTKGRGVFGSVTTATLAVSGGVELSGTIGRANSITDVPDGVSMIATAAAISAGIVTATPTAARALTTDTAVAILALLTGAVGQVYEFTLINIGAGGIITLAGGIGVTIVGTTTTAPSTSSRWFVRVASATTIVLYRG